MLATKQFFKMNDGSADFLMISCSLEHAKQIMRDAGIEFGTEGVPYDVAKARNLLSWEEEMSAESASTKQVYRNDETTDDLALLTQSAVRSKTGSEY